MSFTSLFHHYKLWKVARANALLLCKMTPPAPVFAPHIKTATWQDHSFRPSGNSPTPNSWTKSCWTSSRCYVVRVRVWDFGVLVERRRPERLPFVWAKWRMWVETKQYAERRVEHISWNAGYRRQIRTRWEETNNIVVGFCLSTLKQGKNILRKCSLRTRMLDNIWLQ